MFKPAARRVPPAWQRLDGVPLRMAFLGPPAWLGDCAPPPGSMGGSVLVEHFELLGDDAAGQALDRIEAFEPDVCVLFDPWLLDHEQAERLPGVRLGLLVDGLAAPQQAGSKAVGLLGALDRLVSFAPSCSGEQLNDARVWRAIPPPVSDVLFADVRPLHHAPRAIAIGAATEHREAMLLPAKHHHDLLHVVHGVSGRALAALLAEYDVGVYAGPRAGAFERQVGIHLACGQLLLSERLRPAHGLECGIDYLNFDSPEALVWLLERLARFPEMYQRIRVRGRMKAERYRASHLFRRLTFDLLADVAAFGCSGDRVTQAPVLSAGP